MSELTPTPTLVNKVFLAALGSRAPFPLHRLLRPEEIVFLTHAGEVEGQVERFHLRDGKYELKITLPDPPGDVNSASSIVSSIYKSPGQEEIEFRFGIDPIHKLTGRLDSRRSVSWGTSGVSVTFSITNWSLTSGNKPAVLYGTIPAKLDMESSNMWIKIHGKSSHDARWTKLSSAGHVMHCEEYRYFIVPDKDNDGNFSHLVIELLEETEWSLPKIGSHLTALSLAAGMRFYCTSLVGFSSDLQIVSRSELRDSPLVSRAYSLAVPGTTIEYASALGQSIGEDRVVNLVCSRLAGSSTSNALQVLLGLRDSIAFLNCGTTSNMVDVLAPFVASGPERQLVEEAQAFLDSAYKEETWTQMTHPVKLISILTAIVSVKLGSQINFEGPYGRGEHDAVDWILWSGPRPRIRAVKTWSLTCSSIDEYGDFRWGEFAVPEIPTSGPVAVVSHYMKRIINETGGLVRAKVYAAPTVSGEMCPRYLVRVFPALRLTSKSTIATIDIDDTNEVGVTYTARSPFLQKEHSLIDGQSARALIEDLSSSSDFRQFIVQLMEISQELAEEV